MNYEPVLPSPANIVRRQRLICQRGKILSILTFNLPLNMMAAGQEKERLPQKDLLWIPANPFIQALREVSFVAPRNTSLSRIKIAYGKAGLVLAATDGFRLVAELVTQKQVAKDGSEGNVHINVEQLVHALRTIFPRKTRSMAENFSLEVEDKTISICNGASYVRLPRSMNPFDLQRYVDQYDMATPNSQLDVMVQRKDLLHALRKLDAEKKQKF